MIRFRVRELKVMFIVVGIAAIALVLAASIWGVRKIEKALRDGR